MLAGDEAFRRALSSGFLALSGVFVALLRKFLQLALENGQVGVSDEVR